MSVNKGLRYEWSRTVSKLLTRLRLSPGALLLYCPLRCFLSREALHAVRINQEPSRTKVRWSRCIRDISEWNLCRVTRGLSVSSTVPPLKMCEKSGSTSSSCASWFSSVEITHICWGNYFCFSKIHTSPPLLPSVIPCLPLHFSLLIQLFYPACRPIVLSCYVLRYSEVFPELRILYRGKQRYLQLVSM
jgi:hypothetical protein